MTRRSLRGASPSSTANSDPSSRKPPTAPPRRDPKQSSKQPLAFQTRSPPKRAPPPVAPHRINRYRKPLLLATSAVGALISFRIAFAYTAYKRDAEHYASLETPIPADVSNRYRSTRSAETYDGDVDTMEWLMGISRLREKLMSHAKGHVLEASVGTGRNAGYFPLTKGIKSVTMVDTSPEMLDVARLKWAKKNAWFIHALFRIQSSADDIPLPSRARDQDGFDTVVQTMGICSTTEPEKALANFGRLCRPDGRILLLEHGRGHYGWLNRWIDAIAPAHADREGCWFNKDIGEIVRRSGLEIIEEKRFHFGTTWWYILKPTPALLQGDNAETASESPKNQWWWPSSWWK